jgi:hypothetical protein
VFAHRDTAVDALPEAITELKRIVIVPDGEAALNERIRQELGNSMLIFGSMTDEEVNGVLGSFCLQWSSCPTMITLIRITCGTVVFGPHNTPLDRLPEAR